MKYDFRPQVLIPRMCVRITAPRDPFAMPRNYVGWYIVAGVVALLFAYGSLEHYLNQRCLKSHNAEFCELQADIRTAQFMAGFAIGASSSR